jgi:predicted small lipoprotein YifL
MVSKPVGISFSQIAIAVLLTIFTATPGCGKKGVPKIASNTKAFETASSEIKADWEKAITAAASHDYATAILTCRKLQLQKELTPEQRTAVTDTITAENNQLLDGLRKGDPNAIQANEEVRKGWRHPQ